VKAAPWLRHMVRQITITDFPASWQAATPRERSHDSRTYTERFMLRLDESSQTKLQQLIKQFGASKADIIRQLIAQAKPEAFPKGWHMKALERRAQQPHSL
jgi:RNA:NAD 2'-phosphotransferase (TPT1/KptA family)